MKLWSDSFRDGGVIPAEFAFAEPDPVSRVRLARNYSSWFAGDPQMAGDYFGYDGPCPPWNDLRVHYYVFRLYALDVPRLPLDGRFTGPQASAAMRGHILDEAQIIGAYSLNPQAR
jgi:phosphatidylethanolamine-binding protein (PEBP) family uncharacterized protein